MGPLADPVRFHVRQEWNWAIQLACSERRKEVYPVVFLLLAATFVKPQATQRIDVNVLDLEDKPARRYMTPRREIVYLNRYDSMEEKLQIAVESGHTRFPLCEEDLDHILGIVHVKDMFHTMHTKSELTQLVELARDALFLPETIKLDVLLVELQRRQAVFAMLVDEYGVVSGMITLENVIEQVVGPIQDEFDSEKPPLIRKGVHRYEAEASCPVERVVDGIQFDVPEDITADTLGGVMTGVMGHIPQQGEEVVVGHHKLTVLEAEPRRVLRILIEQVEEEGES